MKCYWLSIELLVENTNSLLTKANRQLLAILLLTQLTDNYSQSTADRDHSNTKTNLLV